VDSVRKTGELRYGKYEKGKPMQLDSRYFYNDVHTFNYAQSSVPTYERFYPSIMVSNPTKSSDVRDVRIAAITGYQESQA